EAELQRARGFRQLGLYDKARTALNTLLTQNPHHPLVLHELATTYEEQESWRALESLGKAERGATRDSLLLSHEYANALEQLKRNRDAAQVVVETWLASPGEGGGSAPTCG